MAFVYQLRDKYQSDDNIPNASSSLLPSINFSKEKRHSFLEMRRLFTSPSTDSTSSVFQFGVHTNLIFLMCLRLIKKRKKLDGLGAPSNDLLTSIKSTDVLLMFTLSYDEKPEKATSGQEQQQQHDVLSAVWEKSRNVVKLR